MPTRPPGPRSPANDLQGHSKIPDPSLNLLQQKAFRDEQSIVLGRLTAHLCHSINNSLQAVGGALTLALEEPDVPQAVVEYLRLCQVEVQRETRVIDQIRQVYRPQGEVRETDLKNLVEDVIAMTSEEADRLGVEIHQNVEAHLPKVRVAGAPLRLALLSIVLRMIDVAAETGKGRLDLQGRKSGESIVVEMSIEGGSVAMGASASSAQAKSMPPGNEVEVPPIAELVRTQGGTIDRLAAGKNVGIRVTLPV